ncbi:MAG: hypothetical protein LBK57_07580, partial [Clostridiales Family XIII bacterium]|nr:hypothetical protein [Clostridiales Family XIII bacterium]
MNNKEKYNARLKRFKDVIALKEPDAVPCVPVCNTYYVSHAGYTMADILYSVSKAKDAALKYMKDYEPDLAITIGTLHAGTGPIKEKLENKWLQWAGQPGSSIDVNSIHQYIEKPYMKEDEYPEFLGDMTGWMLKKFLPQGYGLMEPLKKLDFYNMRGMDISFQCIQFADPEVRRSLKILGEVGEAAKAILDEYADLDRQMTELGFPLQFPAIANAPFDQLSDNLRGTLDVMTDMYEQPENVLAAVEKFLPRTISDVTDVLKPSPDATNLVFMPLHKGMDGFMSDEHYRKFYWDTLLKVVNGFIDAGLTPWIYTEGKYDSRVECLMDVPKGKAYIHFEEADMSRVKKLLGNVACLSGGISSSMLVYDTKEQVIEKIKRHMDILAPGGGFIFDLGDTI